MRAIRSVFVLALAASAIVGAQAANAQDVPRDPATPQQPQSPRDARTPRTPRTPRTSIPADDKDCNDFRTRAEAQKFFEAQGPGDPHRLDADGDGKACETLPGSASLPKTGSPVVAFGSGGSILLLTGILLLDAARRKQIVPSAPAQPAAAWGDEPLIGW